MDAQLYQDIEKSKRYYPTEKETMILISNLKQYFKNPERSPERNKIAAKTSSDLQKINPHWTHRTVRLWFNNNKQNYLNSTQNTSEDEYFDENQSRIDHSSCPTLTPNDSNHVESSNSNLNSNLIKIRKIFDFNSKNGSSPSESSFRSVQLKRDNKKNQVISDLQSIYQKIFFDKNSIVKQQPNVSEDKNSIISSLSEIFEENHDFISSQITPIDILKNFKETKVIQIPQIILPFSIQYFMNQTSDAWISPHFDVTSLPSFDYSYLDQTHSVFSKEKEKQLFIQETDQIINLPPFLNKIQAVYMDTNIYITDGSHFAIRDFQNFNPEDEWTNVTLTPIETDRTIILPITSDENRILILRNSNSYIYEKNKSLLKSFSQIPLFLTATTFKDSFLISDKNLPFFHNLDFEGNEQRAFIGHLHKITGLHSFNECNIISGSKANGTLLIWDSRVQYPVYAVNTSPWGCASLAGEDNLLFAALEDGKIRMIDIRETEKVIGIDGRMGQIVKMYYKKEINELSAFSKDPNMFVKFNVCER